METALSLWGSLLLATPRIAGLMILIPFLRPPQVPAPARNAFIFALALLVSPMVYGHLQEGGVSGHGTIFLLALKEMAVGMLMGLVVGFLFHIPQAVGDFIDNQRGASIAALFNPALGEQSSNLGLFMAQAFLVWFISLGGFTLLFRLLFFSYAIYPVGALLPLRSPESMALLIKAMSDYVAFAFLLAGPVIFPMLVSEIALGLVSRFAPQLNVFFLAMPMKSVISLFILALYLGIFLKHLSGVQPFFDLSLDFLRSGGNEAAATP